MRFLFLIILISAISTSIAYAADPAETNGNGAASASTESISILVLIGIMTVAGVAGGSINYVLLSREDETGWQIWAKSALSGAGASFLMPLFLNTISSTLVPNILEGKGQSGDVLVFSGFCLLAAISSRAFIQTLSDRILREAQEAKKQAQEARDDVSEVEQAVATIVEPDSEVSTEGAEGAEMASIQVTDDQRAFLKAIDHSRFTLRSVSGIAKQAGLSQVDTVRRLEAMVSNRLVMRIEGKKGERWSLTLRGRQAIAE